MRLDKFIVSTGKLSRSDAGRAARSGRITVDGAVEKHADRAIDPAVQKITLDGVPLTYRQYTYLLLNKPEGYVSATQTPGEPTVLDLLPDELRRIGLFPSGRLDKYTVGLMLLTNDGALSHDLLSPRHHVKKKYAYTCRDALSEDDRIRLENGVSIDGYVTKPCQVTQTDETHGTIVLTEGKYHQIKRMFDVLGNKITALERLTFGPLSLDGTLARGEWRYLTEDEILSLQNHIGNVQTDD